MEQPTQTPKPKSKNLLLRGFFIALITASVTLIVVPRVNALKPQLDIKNTGAIAVMLRRGGDSFVVQPGQTWHIRFWPGATVNLYAGATEAAYSRSVTLEKRDVQPGNPPRVPVEVRVDSPTNLVFEYVGTK